jgi:hypothetical protein
VWLFLFIFIESDMISGLMTPSLVMLCLVITEALPAPIRTTWNFLMWCSTDDDGSDINDKEMAALSQVV